MKERFESIEAAIDLIRQLTEDRFKYIIVKLKHLNAVVFKIKLEVMKEESADRKRIAELDAEIEALKKKEKG